jgi:hypothetical protein
MLPPPKGGGIFCLMAHGKHESAFKGDNKQKMTGSFAATTSCL